MFQYPLECNTVSHNQLYCIIQAFPDSRRLIVKLSAWPGCQWMMLTPLISLFRFSRVQISIVSTSAWKMNEVYPIAVKSQWFRLTIPTPTLFELWFSLSAVFHDLVLVLWMVAWSLTSQALRPLLDNLNL